MLFGQKSRLEMLMTWNRICGLFLHHFLHYEVHEQIQWLGLDDQRPSRPVRVVVEMLVYAGIFHGYYIARLPVIADAIVDLMSPAIEDVKYSLVHMAMFVRFPAWRQDNIMGIKDLGIFIFRRYDVTIIVLRPLFHYHVFPLDHTGYLPKTFQLLPQTISIAC